MKPGGERLWFGAEPAVVAGEHLGLRPQPFGDGNGSPIGRLALRRLTQPPRRALKKTAARRCPGRMLNGGTS